MTLKTWEEDDVEIQITDCGICGSDIHTLDEVWRPTIFPAVVGHEIAGTVTRVGKNVTNVKVGDRAGVGPIADSCGKCTPCTHGISNICEGGPTGTYNGKYGTPCPKRFVHLSFCLKCIKSDSFFMHISITIKLCELFLFLHTSLSFA
jgi:D-arabinose 1-dehydrogenase-like Zn-dependent alcohol dehydrogenase